MKPFNLTTAAKTDLRDIALFTERRWGKEQRNIYLKQFDDSFWLLAENPDIGKSCDKIRDGYRKFPQGSHVIFYQQTGSQQIRVVRILLDILPTLKDGDSLYRTLMPERENVPSGINVAVVRDTTRTASPFSYSKICDTFRPLIGQCATI